MSPKTFVAIAFAAVIAVIAAGVAVQQKPDRSGAPAGGPLFPGLLDHLNEAEVLALQSQAGSVTLQKTADGWGMVERGGYPVRPDRVRGALLGLAQAETIEPKTANPDLYGELGVRDPAAEGATSLGIEALDGAGQRLAAVIVGHRKTGATGIGGVYVRKPGEKQSWLAHGLLGITTDPADWLVRDVMDLPASEVVRITITHPDGETWTGIREPADAKHLTIDGVDLATDFTVDDVADVLSRLDLDDVRPADTIQVPEKYQIKATIETRDGLVFRTRSASLMDEYWLWIDVEGEGEKAEALRSKVSGWAFKIPAFKGVRLTKRLDDLRKKKSEAPAGAMPAPAAN